ncbi:hypothetical protein AMK59_2045, partial [Oryctes borbonicus]
IYKRKDCEINVTTNHIIRKKMKFVISYICLFVAFSSPRHCWCYVFGSACSRIISRKEWNSRNINTTIELSVRPLPYVIIHHSAGKECFNLEECSGRVRSIQDKHIDERNWSDIGYNFLIGSDGQSYEGRGWGKIGAHAFNWNRNSVGICLMGMFTERLPTSAALRAAQKLIDCGLNIGEIGHDYKLMGHRQVVSNTACPGQALYDTIRTWQRWIPRPGNVENNDAFR